ncbi:hypothetical protein acdb102_29080 [Acidothermaceae bacterium B102]|nr:hypothetical protein acdb102_29080 [Acidothermaceae bacterium B102]
MDDAVLLMRVAVSWLASVVTVGAAVLLRADSDGPAPGWPTLVLAIATLAAVFWPMTASRRRLPAFVTSVVALQVSGHALLLFAATGHLAHSGPSGLFCCPPTPSTAHGVLSLLTANAGWLLLLVQLVVAAALALPLRLLHKAFLALGKSLASVVQAALPLVSMLFTFAPLTRPVLRPRPPRLVGRAGRHVVGVVQRRGPPALARVRSSSTPSVPLGACA